MRDLRSAVDDYLTIRRRLGYKLEREGSLLPEFADFVEREGSDVITARLAVAWATRPVGEKRRWHAARLGMVRRLASFVRTLDPRTEVPSAELLPYRHVRSSNAYLYSAADVLALMDAARRFPGTLKRHTYATLLGLLATTGMRVGEAIALDRGDFNESEDLLVVRHAKFGKSREVVLHPTTVAALRAYARVRDRAIPQTRGPSFFVSQSGTRLIYQNVHIAFLVLVRKAGLWERRPRRPRIHDLRHSFAVRTLIDWYREGVDVEARLPRLSTYLGHVCPSTTYYYLSAASELVGLAAGRLERALGELP